MGVNKLLTILIFLVIFISGCFHSRIQVTTPPKTLSVSEPTEYNLEIYNPYQLFIEAELSNFSLEFIPSEDFFIDKSRINFDTNSIKKQQIAKATITIISLSVGDSVIDGQLNYSYNNVKKSYPIKINIHTPQLGNENFINLELKEKGFFNPSTDFGRPKTLHIIIKKEKEDRYNDGMVIIISDKFSTLDCVKGYEKDCKKEGNRVNITTPISKDIPVPFVITVNKPSPRTEEYSFTFTAELWYNKDGSSRWGKITQNNFKVNTNN